MPKDFIKPHHIIVCEGNSENAYINILNRFLRDNYINKSFIPKIVGTGEYSAVTRLFKQIKSNNKRNTSILIWIDHDRYKRNDNHNMESYVKKKANIPDFKFNKYSFEDFFIMHYNDDILNKWKEICEKNNHFNLPMKSELAKDLLCKHIFPDYTKSSLLPSFVINEESLNNLFKHQKDPNCKFKSDFADFLMKELEEYI